MDVLETHDSHMTGHVVRKLSPISPVTKHAGRSLATHLAPSRTPLHVSVMVVEDVVVDVETVVAVDAVDVVLVLVVVVVSDVDDDVEDPVDDEVVVDVDVVLVEHNLHMTGQFARTFSPNGPACVHSGCKFHRHTGGSVKPLQRRVDVVLVVVDVLV